ncbi:recombinase family protein [Photobacterium phosphoreum]|uniref:recombinase family protein n=1 Tax=Photobacterium phosphoreum TaxID=659 RepID=UPI000D181374|nr:recombinase family protein [Photobacterium phosphoreum]PSU32165.1 resolvase [Photobacterium phosphoreum]
MKVVNIGFARVSTQQQDLTSQVDQLLAAGCLEKNILSFKHSGKSDANKAALNALISRVTEIQELVGDNVQIVVIATKIDRIARSLNQLLNVMEELGNLNVQLKTLDGSIDSTKTDPLSRAMLQMAGIFAELERSLIVTRTQEGKLAKGEAAIGGRPKTTITLEMINKVKEENEGISAKGVAEKLKCSRTTVFKIIKDNRE